MSPGAPGATALRRAALVASLVVLVAAVVPPLAVEARRFESAEAVQFALLAVAVPPLVALGAPFARLRGAARVAAARRRHARRWRGAGFLAAGVAVPIAWRTPAAVDALVRHEWLLLLEVATLVPAGVGLWLELVESPPLVPRATRPARAVTAAVAMWALWVAAYALGLSRATVYTAFPHHAGGLSVAADQQITAAIVWFAALCAFAPVAFANVLRWLKEGEQPDDELRRLLREEARRGGRR